MDEGQPPGAKGRGFKTEGCRSSASLLKYFGMISLSFSGQRAVLKLKGVSGVSSNSIGSGLSQYAREVVRGKC